jgi:hypothetical protein
MLLESFMLGGDEPAVFVIWSWYVVVPFVVVGTTEAVTPGIAAFVILFAMVCSESVLRFTETEYQLLSEPSIWMEPLWGEVRLRRGDIPTGVLSLEKLSLSAFAPDALRNAGVLSLRRLSDSNTSEASPSLRAMLEVPVLVDWRTSLYWLPETVSTLALTPAFASFILAAMLPRVSVEATEISLPLISMSPEYPRAVLDEEKLSDAICSGVARFATFIA